VKVSQIDVRR